MVGNLPENHICWRMVQDHERADLFFLATEFGIFSTLDAGENWFKLKSGLPTISFRDLEIQKRENDLVAASFGRSFYVLDDYSLLRDAKAETFEKKFHMFPVRRAFWYVPSDPIGGSKGYQGDSFYSASNPEFGAVFNYYIGESFESKRAKRKEKEAALKKAGKDVPTVSVDELRAEAEEISPSYFVRITDSDGTVVAKNALSGGKGIHRSTWSLRHQAIGVGRRGPMVAPGTYTAQAFKVVGAEEISMCDPVEFEVESIIDPTLDPKDRVETLAFVEEVGRVANRTMAVSSVLNDRIEQIDELLAAVKRHPKGTAELVAEANAFQKRLAEYQRKMVGDPIKAQRWMMDEPGIVSRIRGAMFSAVSGTYGPTETAIEQYEIGLEQFEEIEDDLRTLIEDELESYEEKLDEAGIPWTKGRNIPK